MPSRTWAILDDTLVYYIVGDNGASAEGTLNGTFNEMIIFNGAAALETPEFVAAHDRRVRQADAYNHFAVGWAHAMDTPYQWTKQVASPLGRHPQRHDRALAARHHGQGRDAGPVPPRHRRGADHSRGGGPARADGRQRRPAARRWKAEHGLLASTMRGGRRAHDTQYFEMFCNRGIYHQGWTAVTRHSTPWVDGSACRPSTTMCGSCTTPDDWSQARDLAAEMPEKLASCSGCR